MILSIIEVDNTEHTFTDISLAVYDELDDLFRVYVKGELVFESRMGDIGKLELQP